MFGLKSDFADEHDENESIITASFGDEYASALFSTETFEMTYNRALTTSNSANSAKCVINNDELIKHYNELLITTISNTINFINVGKKYYFTIFIK